MTKTPSLTSIKNTVGQFVSAIGVLLLSTLGSSAFADTYTFDLFHVDDIAYAYISNSLYTNQLIASSGFSYQGTGYVDISSFVQPGTNVINIQNFNGPAGWAIAWDLQQNGVSIGSYACGNWNAPAGGCNNDSYQQGLVYNQNVSFTAVPLPPSIWLLGGCLLGLAGASRRRNSAVASD